MSLQKSHQEVKNLVTKRDVVVVAENIRTPENMGMIFRVAEAFGVGEVIFAGTHGIELSTKAKRASRSTFQKINYHFRDDITQVLTELEENGYLLLALEITKESRAIQEFDFAAFPKIALTIGSERQGISENALLKIPHAVHIPLYGDNSSINVVSALSIALHEMMKADQQL